MNEDGVSRDGLDDGVAGEFEHLGQGGYAIQQRLSCARSPASGSRSVLRQAARSPVGGIGEVTGAAPSLVRVEVGDVVGEVVWTLVVRRALVAAARSKRGCRHSSDVVRDAGGSAYGKPRA